MYQINKNPAMLIQYMKSTDYYRYYKKIMIDRDVVLVLGGQVLVLETPVLVLMCICYICLLTDHLICLLSAMYFPNKPLSAQLLGC